MAFSIGFYVSMEKLVPEKANKNCTTQPSGGDYNPFNTGFQSFVKTSAMFSGEFVSYLMKFIKICTND